MNAHLMEVAAMPQVTERIDQEFHGGHGTVASDELPVTTPSPEPVPAEPPNLPGPQHPVPVEPQQVPSPIPETPHPGMPPAPTGPGPEYTPPGPSMVPQPLAV